MCRRHCVANGGCTVKTHTQGVVAPLRQSTPETTSPVPEPEPAQDLFADPCHASQMTAVFTQHYARKQTIQEERRAADAECMANDVRARHSVIVYGWAQGSMHSTLFFRLIKLAFRMGNNRQSLKLKGTSSGPISS